MISILISTDVPGNSFPFTEHHQHVCQIFVINTCFVTENKIYDLSISYIIYIEDPKQCEGLARVVIHFYEVF